MSEKILQLLSELFAEKDIITSTQALHYGEDESHASEADVLAVVFPKTHQQLVDLVALARQERFALVPSGGRTGLSGAAVAQHGEIVVSFEKMNALIEMDVLSRQVTVQAGMTIEKLQEIAAENGLYYPVDYASKGSAQIGGALATNAGGVRVLKYGMTRDWVAGFKAVTGAGQTLSINRNLVKDNAGFNLKDLLIGSEGTLGLISEVTVNLAEPMAEQQTLLLAFHSLDMLISTFDLLRSKVSLNAAEFFCQNSLDQVCSVFDRQPPFEQRFTFYLLFEFDVESMAIEELAECLGDTPAIVSQSIEQSKMLWSYRELVSSSLNPRAPYKNDIACKLSMFKLWLDELEHIFTQLDCKPSVAWFGHLGDGNVHINVLKPKGMASEDFEKRFNEFDEKVAHVCQKYHASISAEHGIGILKKGLLPYGRSEVEIGLYKQIKMLFDPDDILNPGKIFD